MLIELAYLLMLLSTPAIPPCDTPKSMVTNERQWKRIEHQDGVVVYTPPEGSERSMRLEYLLPSGEKIIEDRDAGLAVRIEMREGVEWTTFSPRGAELPEQEIRQRAAAGECFVVFRYQDSVDSDGAVRCAVLRSVEEYAGRNLVHQAEPNLEVPPPPHLMGTHILLSKD